MGATIAKHPIHPMLVVFPIGLWIFSLVCDLVFLFGPANPLWRNMAFYTMAGGWIGAFAAAVPGLIDYFSMSPGAAKRTATTHMTLNLVAVALYAINLWIRWAGDGAGGWPMGLSVVAVLLMAAAGWLGGELVYVHGDQRKASSGPAAARSAPGGMIAARQIGFKNSERRTEHGIYRLDFFRVDRRCHRKTADAGPRSRRIRDHDSARYRGRIIRRVSRSVFRAVPRR